MSEPTGGDQQQPVPDPSRGQGEVPDDSQAPAFNDPTAPVWSDPTAAIPAPPTAPPVSNPYAPPPAQPAGQPQPSPQYPAYGQPPPGPQYAAYGQQPYATGPKSESNTSAIVLTIVSGVSVLSCNLLAIASLVFGIVALNKNAADPEGSRRMSKIGWIVFASVWAVAILAAVAALALLVSTSNNSSFNY